MHTNIYQWVLADIVDGYHIWQRVRPTTGRTIWNATRTSSRPTTREGYSDRAALYKLKGISVPAPRYDHAAMWWPASSVRDANEGGTTHMAWLLQRKYGGCVCVLSDDSITWHGPKVTSEEVIRHNLTARGIRSMLYLGELNSNEGHNND